MNNVFVADETQPATQRSLLRRFFLPTVRRWLREPLLHFLLIGALLFGLYELAPSAALTAVAPSKDQSS